MTTKEKILYKSLELFNQKGIDSITVRHIAKALNMSHGNLCYHFPNTNTIIETLYRRFVADLDMTVLRGGISTIKSLYDVTLQSYEKLYEYRFIMLEFPCIIRRNPSIKMQQKQLTVMRQIHYQFLITELVKKGLFKAPAIENQYMTWIHSAIFFGDFWVSSAEFLFTGKEQDKVKSYHHFFMNLTIPYLTEKGVEELKALL